MYIFFLPLSAVKYDFDKFNINFICYNNGKQVGEGKILKEYEEL